VKDNIVDAGMRMTRRTLLATASMMAAPLLVASGGPDPERAFAAEAPVKAANADKFPRCRLSSSA